jgi:hypothetical protein
MSYFVTSSFVCRSCPASSGGSYRQVYAERLEAAFDAADTVDTSRQLA